MVFLSKKTLDVNGYKEKVKTFKRTFEECYQMWGLPETLKIHILSSHVEDFLEMTGQTCWSTNDENVECVHQLLERRNLRHGFKKTKNLVGAYKRKCSAQSIRFFIAKNMRKKRS